MGIAQPQLAIKRCRACRVDRGKRRVDQSCTVGWPFSNRVEIASRASGIRAIFLTLDPMRGGEAVVRERGACRVETQVPLSNMNRFVALSTEHISNGGGVGREPRSTCATVAGALMHERRVNTEFRRPPTREHCRARGVNRMPSAASRSSAGVLNRSLP